MWSRTPSRDSIPLVTIRDIRTLDIPVLQRRWRALTQTAYLGDKVVLCRVMGRYKMYVASDDIGFGSHVMLDGFWESWLTQFMARLIQPGMYVADVGANHGYYTLLMAEIVGDHGRVAAVEPHPVTAGHLSNTIAVNGFHDRVELMEIAVGNVSKDDQVFLMPTGEPKNARLVDALHAGRPDRVTVNVRPLDMVFHDWPKLDFIKMDVEGAEEEALLGARQTLERFRPALLLEFNVGRARNPKALLGWLADIYGPPEIVSVDGTTRPASSEELLDPEHTEDWMLFYTTGRPARDESR
jgi:FkbM family methyltransferase